MPKGPMGGPRPAAKAKLTLYTTYDVPREVGLSLDDTEKRRSLENRLQQGLDRIGFKDALVELSPAGSVVGVEVELNTKSATSEDEDEMLDFLDRSMKDEAGNLANRPASDRPEYEWRAK